MRNLLFFLGFTFLCINYSLAQEKWELLGTVEVADIVKLVKDNGRYYALTDNGIYYTEENENKWVIIEGTLDRVGFDGFPAVDFYVSDDNIYLIYADDILYEYITVSNDFGNTWKQSLGRFRGIGNVLLSGDTIQFVSKGDIYYSTDGLKSYDYHFLPSNAYLWSGIDFFNLKYVVTDQKSLNKLFFKNKSLEIGEKLLDLPAGYEYLQSINADSLVFVWATDKKDFVLFRINTTNGDISKSLVFDYNRSISNHSSNISSSTYFKYEDSVLSMVTNKYYGSNVTFVSYDLGENWSISKSFPNSYKEYFGDTLFININDKIYVSTDHGESLIPYGKGIFANYNTIIRSEGSEIFLSVNDYHKSQCYKKKENSKNFIHLDFLDGLDWVADGDQNIYVVKEKKLWKWDSENEKFDDRFSVNNGDTLWNVFIANDILFVTKINGMSYSLDHGKNWIESQEKINFSQIIYFKQEYYISGESKNYKSKDLKTWEEIKVNGLSQWANTTGTMWVVDDNLYLRPGHSFAFGKYNEIDNSFNGFEDFPFSYNLHSSDFSSGLAIIDSVRMFTFHKHQGIKYSKYGGIFWEDIDDFKNSKIYDVKVINDYVYVLDMYGLWRKPIELLFTSVELVNYKGLNNITLFPNPVSNYFSLECQEPFKIISLTILDEYGRKVNNYRGGDDGYDVSALISGKYYVILETEDGINVKKMMKVE